MFLDNIVNKAWNHLTSFGNRLFSSGRKAAYIGAATLILAAGARLARAETRYVDDDAKGLNNGTSWINEYGHLEDELTVASIGNEQISFVARPDIGYVVKSEEKTDSISTLSGTLRLYGAEDIRPIGGLDRKGVSIVYSNLSASENKEIIEMLRANSRIKYAAPLFSVNGETIAIIPEIVARVTDETNSEQLQALCETIGLNIKKRMEYTKSEYLIEVLGNNANAVFAGVEQLNQLSYIEWAAPNIAFQLRFCGGVEPNDTYFSRQWHLQRINAPQAWEITKGDPKIVVAVLDTGVNYNHEDLKANIWRNHGEIPDNGVDDDENEFVDDVYGWDFKNNNPNPIDSEGHGTACAGLIAAQGNNGIGVAGVTWNCKIMPIKIAQTGEDFCTEADLSTAIRYAAKNGADVLSNSWYKSPFNQSQLIIDITKPGGMGRNGKGCVVLAATGGRIKGTRSILPPARLGEVIAVGATDHMDKRTDYSNYGDELELMAPGNNLYTTSSIGSYMQFSGTSTACPVAAGVVALILSENPNLTNLEVRRILSRSAIDLGIPNWDEEYGFGRVDAYKAVKMAQNPPQALTLFVDDDATNDLGPGDPNISDPLENGKLEHPFDAIQEGINNAITGDTVIVLPGIYSGKGNYNISFKGKDILVRSRDGPGSCIIDCQELGRGFYFSEVNSIVEGFTITNGKADKGGGISIWSGSPRISNCIFSGNSVGRGLFDLGGGVYIDDGNPTLINCTFSRNSTYHGGGGIHSRGFGDPTVINCIFWGNTRDNVPSQISGRLTFLYYSNIQGGQQWSLYKMGNISIDPCFADPNNGDYHLKSQAGRWDPITQSWVIDDVTSPCIDAGNPGSSLENELLNLPNDPNNIRGINLRINMGAYGGTVEASIAPHGYALLGDLNNDGIINIKDFVLLVKYWLVAEKEQPGDLNRDGIVNEKDLALLAKDWLKQTVWYKQ